MPHITQRDSALARVEGYVLEAKTALDCNRPQAAAHAVDLALGALTFAGNSQTRLIDASNAAAKAMSGYRDWRTSTERNALLDAIEHAESPGID